MSHDEKAPKRNPPGRRGRLSRVVPLLIGAVSVLVLDQVSKLVVRAAMVPGQSVPADGFFRITYVVNTGGVFGIMQSETFLITLASLAGIVAIILYARYAVFNSALLTVALGLLLGGALGNLIDRLSAGRVVDFIDIGVGSYRWPTFNVADSAIVIGTVLAIYYILVSTRRQAQGER
ncbi:MAG: signal peptidase II [Chloroflexota bacterium]|nr:signal peptidase II [Chloroflexota bacterium]